MPKIGGPLRTKSRDGAHGVIQRRRIARAVGEKNSGGLVGQRLGGRGGRGHHLDLETVLPQAAQDVVFHPVIERHDGNVRRRQRRRCDGVVRAARQFEFARFARRLRPKETALRCVTFLT